MNNREYGIDLLRLFATLGVITLHIFGIESQYNSLARGGVINYNIANFLRIICMSSVNVFGLITGYLYSQRNTHKYISIIRLIIEVLFYSILITVLVYFLKPDWIRGKMNFVESIFPFGTRLWYTTAYIFVFCVIPYLNIFVRNCERKDFSNLLKILFVLLSICTTFGLKDYFSINMGYSCFWLVYMYLIGAYIKVYNVRFRKNLVIFVYVLTVAILFAWSVVNQLFKNHISDVIYTRFLAYSSPLILLNAICTFLFFRDIDVRNAVISKLLEIISASALAVYIIHAHGLMLDNIVYRALSTSLELNPLLFLLFGFMWVIGIFVICIITDILRLQIEKLSGFILSEQKIANQIDSFLGY